MLYLIETFDKFNAIIHYPCHVAKMNGVFPHIYISENRKCLQGQSAYSQFKISITFLSTFHNWLISMLKHLLIVIFSMEQKNLST
jgi:hypothetical protein